MVRTLRFLSAVKRTLTMFMNTSQYKKIRSRFLIHLARLNPTYFDFVNDRNRVICDLLWTKDFNGIQKLKLRLKKDNDLDLKTINTNLKIVMWLEVHILFIHYTLLYEFANKDRKFLVDLVESYKTRSDYDKIWPDCFPT